MHTERAQQTVQAITFVACDVHHSGFSCEGRAPVSRQNNQNPSTRKRHELDEDTRSNEPLDGGGHAAEYLH